MASPKKLIKQILINRQHKKYTDAVISKNVTYDGWIRDLEKKAVIEQRINEIDIKYLTNEEQKSFLEGCENKNAGNHSKNTSLVCQTFLFNDRERQKSEKKVGIFLSNDFFCRNMDQILQNEKFDVVVITVNGGSINKIAFPGICSRLIENDDIILIYGDEDVKKDEIRENPWLKPDWSPDRFLSSFYFGSLVAVRADALRAAYESCRNKAFFAGLGDGEKLYLLLFEMLRMQGAFAKRQGKAADMVCHIPLVLYHTEEEGYNRVGSLHLPEDAVREFEEELSGKDSRDTLLSVIIPSKDNPEVLFCCLDSLLMKTKTAYSYEIILVDNGSNEENRKRIEEKAEKLNQKAAVGNTGCGLIGVSYVYRQMEFNFSGMCNLGASKARGKLLLFLNDDMEIIWPDWLDLMVKKALLPYAGAVGAKLLYPDTDRIQHAGITNLRVGPAHKLSLLSDSTVHYYGMNRGVHDMLAVTGACLMVKKDVFEEAGGFYEGLAVAFNDVDLCYTIYEMGYYNMVRNDVTLYHHESLSRGSDIASEAKQLRLNKEKDLLYMRHQQLYGRDPFYHPLLAMDMLEPEYGPAYRYQVTLDIPWSSVLEITEQISKIREDACLVVGMECAKDIYKWQYGVSPENGAVKVLPEDMGYYFQGYSFVIGADNACYKKRLLLKNTESKRVWSIPVEDRYRQDISDNLKDQLNVDLTGFAAKMRREEIPEGVYQFGMLAEDVCSRQKLVNWSNWVLENGQDTAMEVKDRQDAAMEVTNEAGK